MSDQPMSAWYKEAIVYQIYPRSFKDSDGDGIGDLRGITEKLDYIKSLGVTAVWLNPVFTSPNDDGGYDISDYYTIQREFGSMQDFDELRNGIHKRGMKLMMDFVFNHSSDEHAWFQQSRLSKSNPYREFYFWKAGKDQRAPNNWPSFFGESAWQLDDKTNEYYLHLYSRKQPDLNWENADLREEIKKILKFWINKGVDAIRLDAISVISKRTEFENADTDDFNEIIERYYANGPRLKSFISELRRDVFDKHHTVTIGEGPGITPENVLDYLGDDGLSMIFHFGHMFMDQGPGGRFDPKPWTLTEFKKIFELWDKAFEDRGWGSIFLGNHDFARMVSRWGNDGDYHAESSKLLLTLLLTMRGTPFIFQGDEIGMTNITLKSVSESRDVETINGWKLAQQRGESEASFLNKVNYAGRDNARTPMQWQNQSAAGFTSGVSWMNVNPNYDSINVDAQERNHDSILNYFRSMTEFRKGSRALMDGRYQPIETTSPELFVFSRQIPGEKLVVALNFSSRQVNFPLLMQGLTKKIGNYKTESTTMRPWEAVVFSESV